MWVWGREFLSRQPDVPRQLEIEKHWLHFLLWGRLGYDPTLDDARIAQLIEARFPGVDGAKVLSAWQDASMIYPLVTGFHWADFDFQWYIEGCRSRPDPAKTASGFHSVETFINQKVHPGTDNLTIPVYVAGITKSETVTGVTPIAGGGSHRCARRCRHRCPACPEARFAIQQQGISRHDQRRVPDGHARQVLRGQDPRRDRARAVPRNARDAAQ